MPKSKWRKQAPSRQDKKSQENAKKSPEGALNRCFAISLGATLCGILQRTWKGVVALSIVVALLASGVYFLPHVSVAPFGVFDPSSSSPALFQITNTSVFPLENIRPRLGVCSIQYEGEGAVPLIGGDGTGTGKFCSANTKIGTYFAPTFWERSYLAVDGYYTIALQDVVTTHLARAIKYADISIVVSYQPWFLPWPREEKEFRFFTKAMNDGKLYWFAK